MQIKTTIKNLAGYKQYLKILEATESFLKKNHYLKLDLPVLAPALIPESYLDFFTTKFQYLEQKTSLYLTPSPELFIKRLLVEKIGHCYYLGKAFRNAEPLSPLHLREFNILEFYKVGKDYRFMKKEIQRMLLFICQKVFRKNKIYFKKRLLNFNKLWEEITVAQAFAKFSQIKPEILFNPQKFRRKAQIKGYQIQNASYEDLFSQIYTQEIEPNLGVEGRPTIISDYPKQMASLAQLNSDGLTCQRFEFYISGIELGDCFTELTNSQEQKQRFVKETKIIKKRSKNFRADWALIQALEKGLPACTGMAVGFDRLAMIFTNKSSIRNLHLVF